MSVIVKILALASLCTQRKGWSWAVFSCDEEPSIFSQIQRGQQKTKKCLPSLTWCTSKLHKEHRQRGKTQPPPKPHRVRVTTQRSYFPGAALVVGSQAPPWKSPFSQQSLRLKPPGQKPRESWEVFSIVRLLHLPIPSETERGSRDTAGTKHLDLMGISMTFTNRAKMPSVPPAAGVPSCQIFPPTWVPSSSESLFSGVFKALVIPVPQTWKQLWWDEKEKAVSMIVSANQMPAPDRSQAKVIREKVYANAWVKSIHTEMDDDEELKFTRCKSSSLEAKNPLTASTGGKASHTITSFL